MSLALYRLLTYNIKRGGVARTRELAAVVQASGADMVVLQEATRPDVVRAIADAAGMKAWGSRPGHSLGFISRHAPASHVWYKPRGSRHAFLEIVPADAPVRVFGVHLSAVHAAWTERRRMYEVAALTRAIKAHQHGFHVLAGDFNTLAPGELLDPRTLPYRLRALVWLSGGRVRWRTIQAVLDAGYVDAYGQHAAGDPGFTFPTWAPHVRLDYVFAPRGFAGRIVDIQVMRQEPVHTASDHFPLLTTLNVA